MERFLVRAMFDYSLKTGRVVDMMEMLSFSESTYQLAMANSMCWYWHVMRREDGHVLRRALEFVVDGQSSKWINFWM